MSYYLYVPISTDNQLLVFAIAPTSGQLQLAHRTTLSKSGYAASADPTGQNLYVGLHSGDDHALASYSIDPATGALTPTGEVPVTAMPCYLSTDRSGRYLLAAYYSGGMATVHRIGSDGVLQDPAAGIYPTAPCAHYIATDPSNRHAFVPHVAATNSIYQFHLDADSGTLTPNPNQPVLAAGQGEGPRHLAFHPGLDVVYADNEQDSSVTVYRLDTSRGTLQAVQTVSTLPNGDFEGRQNNSNAQLHIHPAGTSLYVSNRGHDSIAMFSVDSATGLITSLGQQPGEPTPRAFAIEPQGKFLYGGGDGSTRLLSYRIGKSGALESFGAPQELGGSACWVYPLKVG
ncbi:MAG: beta-propeller fold lactonase family protein [Candidatus Latescibacteria bacterium]|nr:beta-propeller fold lactonase family protein [Candidatus Latescibacterota bacterium]